MPELFDNDKGWPDNFNNNNSTYKYGKRYKKRDEAKRNFVIASYFILIGAMLFAGGLVPLLIQNNGIKNSIKTTATIWGWAEKKDSDGNIIYAHKYEFIIDGQVYYAVSDHSSNNPGKIGTTKTIYVDKNNYNKIYEKISWSDFVLIGGGALIIIIPIAICLVLRSKRKRKEMDSGYYNGR